MDLTNLAHMTYRSAFRDVKVSGSYIIGFKSERVLSHSITMVPTPKFELLFKFLLASMKSKHALP